MPIPIYDHSGISVDLWAMSSNKFNYSAAASTLVVCMSTALSWVNEMNELGWAKLISVAKDFYKIRLHNKVEQHLDLTEVTSMLLITPTVAGHALCFPSHRGLCHSEHLAAKINAAV